MYVMRGVLMLFYHPLSTGYGDGMGGQAMQPRFFSPVHLLGILVVIGIVGKPFAGLMELVCGISLAGRGTSDGS